MLHRIRDANISQIPEKGTRVIHSMVVDEIDFSSRNVSRQLGLIDQEEIVGFHPTRQLVHEKDLEALNNLQLRYLL